MKIYIYILLRETKVKRPTPNVTVGIMEAGKDLVGNGDVLYLQESFITFQGINICTILPAMSSIHPYQDTNHILFIENLYMQINSFNHWEWNANTNLGFSPTYLLKRR